MRAKAIYGLLLGLIFMGSISWAQLTPEQLRLKEEFLRQRQTSTDPIGAEKTEQYKSSVSFSNQDTNYYLPPESSLPPADSGKSSESDKAPTENDLEIFGYNLFDGTEESFSPILEATPPTDYKLGPGDNVLVNLWGRVDMQLDLTIDREGKVFIPKAGEILGLGADTR